MQLAGVFTTLGATYQWTEAGGFKTEVHLALLADTHVKADQSEQYRGFFPYQNMKKVMEQVTAAGPSLMVINGDVARLDGQVGDYVAVQELIEPTDEKFPVLMCLGNHDDRENFHQIFGEVHEGKQKITNKHVMVIERPDMRFVFLDSLMYVNKTPGLLGREQRDWLSAFLRNTDDLPVFIFFHHTPYDGDGDLLDSDRLFDMILPHQKVKAVFYGHSHVYRYDEREHIKLINLPAVGYNFADSQPVGWVEAWIGPGKGVFKLHATGGNGENNGEIKEVRWN